MVHQETSRRRTRILSLHVDLTSYNDAIHRILQLAKRREGGWISFVTAHGMIEAEDDPAFSRLFDEADLVVPDGRPLFWMQRLLGNKGAEQVRGPAIMPMLMRIAEQERIRVGFYGGSEEVIEQIKLRAARELPELQIAFAYSPPFRELTAVEDVRIVEDINSSGTEILFVGLGCPKQERWMALHSTSVRAVKLGVGAAFDIYTGKFHEAPEAISRLGLEWLYRLAQDPRRLSKRYLIGNPRFVLLAVRQLAGLDRR